MQVVAAGVFYEIPLIEDSIALKIKKHHIHIVWI